MSEHSYRAVEILGSSRDRIDAAIRNDVGRVSNTVRGLMGFRLDEGVGA